MIARAPGVYFALLTFEAPVVTPLSGLLIGARQGRWAGTQFARFPVPSVADEWLSGCAGSRLDFDAAGTSCRLVRLPSSVPHRQ